MPLGFVVVVVVVVVAIEDVPLVEFIYVVSTRMPVGVTVGDSGLCCCVPCLSSAIISLCLSIICFF